MTRAKLKELFIEQAQKVSAITAEVSTLREALTYAVDLCAQKEACQLLASGCDLPLSAPGTELCETKPGKILAAPNIDARSYKHLEQLCHKRSIECIRENLRRHLGGLDIGLTLCEGGVAETGTLVLDSTREDVRLATMISETHVAVIPASSIVHATYDMEEKHLELLRAAPNYTAFITGASRTADIERVLTLGVHGPLELHIVIWEGK